MAWIAFLAGTMVGGSLGAIFMALMAMAKDTDVARRNEEELSALKEWRHRHERTS